MNKKGYKIHRKAKQVGAYFCKDSKRPTGGLIYTVGAVRTREFQMGKLGPASGVRRIDPQTGEVLEIISQAEIQKQNREIGKKTNRSKRKRKFTRA